MYPVCTSMPPTPACSKGARRLVAHALRCPPHLQLAPRALSPNQHLPTSMWACGRQSASCDVPTLWCASLVLPLVHAPYTLVADRRRLPMGSTLEESALYWPTTLSAQGEGAPGTHGWSRQRRWHTPLLRQGRRQGRWQVGGKGDGRGKGSGRGKGGARRPRARTHVHEASPSLKNCRPGSGL